MIDAFIHALPNTLGGNAFLAGIIAVSIYLLMKGADLLVEAAVEVARDLGMPKLIIGATIVSLGTTTPECAVSVLAAIRGNGGLAIGNGIGSLICDLALILGLAMILTSIPINRRIVMRQSFIVLGSALLFTLMAYASPAQVITRWMGLILVALLVLYLYASFRWARRERSPILHPEKGYAEEHAEAFQHPRPLWQAFLLLLTGLLILIGASHVLIPGVSLAAFRLGIAEAVIAATLVAFGTSLPELMTAISSVRKGHPELVLGNVLGADALNILFVIGFSALATPLKVDPIFYRFQAPVMIGLLLLFQAFFWTSGERFRRWQGVIFVICYVIFIIYQFV